MKKYMGKKSIIMIIMIVAISVAVLLTICLYILTFIKLDVNDVQTYTIEKRDILQTQGAVGVVNFTNTYDVVCTEEYEIDKIYVNIGDVVQVGEPIFVYQSKELDSQINEYTELLENLGQENSINEQKIKENTAYTEELMQTAVIHAEAEYQQIQNMSNDLLQQLSEYQNEYDSFVSELDACNTAILTQTDETELERLSINSQIYREKIDVYSKLIEETETNLSAVQMQLTQLDYALQTARNEANYSGTSEAQQQVYHEINKKLAKTYEEILSTLKSERENLTVYSDFSGIVTEITAVEGESYFQQAVCKISESEEFTVELEISADKRYAVKTGMKVYMTTDALENREFVGQISDITTGSDGNYILHVVIDDTIEKFVKAGMKVYARIVLDEMKNTLAVPYDSILYDGDKSYVLLLEDGTVSKVEVTVIMESAYYTGITSNQLKEQDIILIDAESYMEEK